MFFSANPDATPGPTHTHAHTTHDFQRTDAQTMFKTRVFKTPIQKRGGRSLRFSIFEKCFYIQAPRGSLRTHFQNRRARTIRLFTVQTAGPSAHHLHPQPLVERLVAHSARWCSAVLACDCREPILFCIQARDISRRAHKGLLFFWSTAAAA